MGTEHCCNDTARRIWKHSESTCPSAIFSIINALGLNPVFHGERPVTGHLSHDTTTVFFLRGGGTFY